MADFSANSEAFESRSTFITKEGINVTRRAKITAAEYADGTYPAIGEAFPLQGNETVEEQAELEKLRAVEVDTDWITNSTVQVTVLYSTMDNRELTRRRRADHISSMRQNFDFSLLETDITNVKIKDKDGNDKKWATEWVAAGTDRDEADAPPQNLFTPSITWTITVYLSQWNWNLVKDRINTVNQNDWLRQLVVDGSTPPNIIDITGDDSGRWLFYNFNAREIGKGVWELVYTFLYNVKEKWNRPLGVTFNRYSITDFNLLPLPTITSNTDTYPFGGRVV